MEQDAVSRSLRDLLSRHPDLHQSVDNLRVVHPHGPVRPVRTPTRRLLLPRLLALPHGLHCHQILRGPVHVTQTGRHPCEHQPGIPGRSGSGGCGGRGVSAPLHGPQDERAPDLDDVSAGRRENHVHQVTAMHADQHRRTGHCNAVRLPVHAGQGAQAVGRQERRGDGGQQRRLLSHSGESK